MGVFSDVAYAIIDLIEPTEGLGDIIIGDALRPVFIAVRDTLVDAQTKGAYMLLFKVPVE